MWFGCLASKRLEPTNGQPFPEFKIQGLRLTAEGGVNSKQVLAIESGAILNEEARRAWLGQREARHMRSGVCSCVAACAVALRRVQLRPCGFPDLS